MKKAGKIIAFLIIIALILVPLAACEGTTTTKTVSTGSTGGTTGAQGEEGAAGQPGRPGAEGAQGEQGSAGEAGATWYSGAGVPAAATGVNDDLYFNTANGDVYKKVSNAWTKIANIKGPQGDQGPMGPEGPVGPMGPEGAEGAQGESGLIDNATIVAIANTYYATSVYQNVSHVLGSNFNPGDTVIITVCENNTFVATDTANACGAFMVYVAPALQGIQPTLPVVSLKAWVDDGSTPGSWDAGDTLWACWPLYYAMD